jgi:hypothetical protein
MSEQTNACAKCGQPAEFGYKIEGAMRWFCSEHRLSQRRKDGRNSNQSFTSIKLRWETCVMAQPRLSMLDKCVAFVIMNAMNEKTRDWKLSDETIAAQLGGKISRESVLRARQRLRKAGWIGWKRTNDANVYFLRHENVWAAMDEIMMGRMARRKRRKERRRNGATCDTRVTSRCDTSVTQTYSRDIHEKKKDKSLPERVDNGANDQQYQQSRNITDDEILERAKAAKADFPFTRTVDYLMRMSEYRQLTSRTKH